MQDGLRRLCDELVTPRRFVEPAAAVEQSRDAALSALAARKHMPEEGWPPDEVRDLLRRLARLDSNHWPRSAGGGEREGRVRSWPVAERHLGFAHGVGRSGDLAAGQPKAPGSTAMAALAGKLVLDVVRQSGVTSANDAMVFPCATGLTLAMCLRALGHQSTENTVLNADDLLSRTSGDGFDYNVKRKYVIWSRIDQKSCLKSMLAAGFTPIVVAPVPSDRYPDQLVTDVEKIEAVLATHAEQVGAVMTTTSAFCPRAPDDLVAVGRLCARHGVAHIVNNAYGLQSTKCCALLDTAIRDPTCRLDVFVQSLDKNLLVPVGGTIVATGDAEVLGKVAKSYPGRATSVPAIDAVQTLLELGRDGWKQLLSERKLLFVELKTKLAAIAAKHGERVLDVPQNVISLGMTLSKMFGAAKDKLGGAEKAAEFLSALGSRLFHSRVTGTRVVITNDASGVRKAPTDQLRGWPSSTDEYHEAAYVTVACAVGMTMREVETICAKLDATLKDRWKLLSSHETTLCEDTSAN